MILLQGKGVVSGVVFGKMHFLKNGGQAITRYRVENIEAELARYKQATQLAIEQLAQLYQKALVEIGEQGALLFDVHQMMLEDDDYCDSICNIIIKQEVNAEYAVAATGDNFAKMFSQMDDSYMKARAADIKDISERLINVLAGCSSEEASLNEPSILMAEDLSPSETMQLDKDKILAFVTAGGSANSHTAILARTMGIPAVIQTENLMCAEYEGCDAIVDGGTGKVYISPDIELSAQMRDKKAKETKKQKLLAQLKGKPNITKDGKEIMVYANISNLSNLGFALENDAGGIGLFRTEFLYLESKDYPTEEEQFQVYKT
ncbi:MAG: phosphoenolpyruvate-utilizing N-terminal domain-containing protein, partial [Sporomusa sp.]